MKKTLSAIVVLSALSGCAVYEPAYVQPRPVYVQPAPVYVPPRPVYVQPRPVYVAPPPPRRPHCYTETYINRYNNTQTTRRVCR
jgi:hypothetical protein